MEKKEKIVKVTKFLQDQLHTKESLEDIIDGMDFEQIAVYMYNYMESRRGEMVSVKEKLPKILPEITQPASLIYEVNTMDAGIFKAIYVLNEEGKPEWRDLFGLVIEEDKITHWIQLHTILKHGE